MKKFIIDSLFVIVVCVSIFYATTGIYYSAKHHLLIEVQQELKVWIQLQKNKRPEIKLQPKKEFTA